MELKFMKAMTFAVCTLSIMSCSNDKEENLPSAHPDTTIVNAQLAAYEGPNQAIAGENDITDMKAFLFKDGIMTEIYELPVSSSDNYNIQIDSRSGNLYLVAYTGGSIPTDDLLGKNLSEEAWKQSIVNIPSAQEHFFTGKIALEGSGNTASVALKRGLARFDLAINAIEEVSVKSVTLRNLAHSTYVFPQDDIISPEDASRRDTTVVFPQPLSAPQDGILFACEQSNQGIEVSVTAVIGGTEKTMSKVFEGPLKRNTAYTLTVRQDHIDITLDVSFEDWEEGSDTELTPYGNPMTTR